jgi:cytochrome c-type biogenesis protein CcmE
MKKLHIILIVLIAVAVAAIIGSISDASTYANFQLAFEQPNKEFHVVGVLSKDKQVIYEPEVNPNIFTFFLLDNEGEERKVILNKSKPQDFDRSEQIVIIGKAGNDGETFIASDILLKCPSKYEDGSPDDHAKTSSANL